MFDLDDFVARCRAAARAPEPQAAVAFGQTVFQVAVEAASRGPIVAPDEPRIVRLD